MKVVPSESKKPVLSVVIPAYNEEQNIAPTLIEITQKLKSAAIPYEIVVVNDNSKDKTPDIVRNLQKKDHNIKLVNRIPPGGFGRAVRSGLENFLFNHFTQDVADEYVAFLNPWCVC